MTEELGFGILGSGNMARVYGDALTTQGRPAAGSSRSRWASRAESLAAEYGVDAEPSRRGAARAHGRRRRRDRHAALDAPAARARGGRGRQARLPREADGARRRGVRPDHRGLPPRPGSSSRSPSRRATWRCRCAPRSTSTRAGSATSCSCGRCQRHAGRGFNNVPQSWPMRPARGRCVPRLGLARLRRDPLVHRRRRGPRLRRLRQLHRRRSSRIPRRWSRSG